jgi:hypothetical protein
VGGQFGEGYFENPGQVRTSQLHLLLKTEIKDVQRCQECSKRNQHPTTGQVTFNQVTFNQVTFNQVTFNQVTSPTLISKNKKNKKNRLNSS